MLVFGFLLGSLTWFRRSIWDHRSTPVSSSSLQSIWNRLGLSWRSGLKIWVDRFLSDWDLFKQSSWDSQSSVASSSSFLWIWCLRGLIWRIGNEIRFGFYLVFGILKIGGSTVSTLSTIEGFICDRGGDHRGGSLTKLMVSFYSDL